MSLPTDPLFPLQWYLDRTFRADAAFDLNVLPVWEDYTGRGVKVAVFDTKIEASHPDLTDNYDPSLHIPLLTNDLPFEWTDNHGTSVAGIIGAARNGEGVVGVAYGATLTGGPVIFGNSVHLGSFQTAMAAARDFDVVNLSFGTMGPFGGGIQPYEWAPIAAGYQMAATEGRGGLGTIVVQASGNHGSRPADANLSYLTTERTAIVVAAVAPGGEVSDYSVSGATVFISGLSGDSTYYGEVTTTDRTGSDGYNAGGGDWDPVPADYTSRFGGTSSAAPMISGVVALMLEANPLLGWRDVQDILAITARHVGSDIGTPPTFDEEYGWTVNNATHVNGVGFHFSPSYGFGLVDAVAAVRLAETWSQTQVSANEAVAQAILQGTPSIPDNSPAGIELPLLVAPGVIAERVQLRTEISHGSAPELRITLISPAGTESILFDRGGYLPDIYGITSPFRDWTFGSNAFRGEDAAGVWRVRIVDLKANGTGTVRGLTLDVFGDTASDDDVYYFTNEFGRLAGITPITTMTDGAGEDMLHAGAVSAALLIDLRPGARSTINDVAVTIAPGTWIENAVGGEGGDTIIGNSVANHLRGARADDFIRGVGGDDVLEGGSGDDRLVGGPGDDSLNGGTGRDRASYATAPAGVVINLAIAGAQNTRGAGVDELTAVEDVVGSAFSDRLVGNAEANRLNGVGGNNVLGGRAGDDALVGGAGYDRLHGGAGDDRLRGGDEADILNGGAGADILAGGAGADLFIFSAVVQSRASAPDRIRDFLSRVDQIDLSAVDANVLLAGMQAFEWKGEAGFSSAAQLRYGKSGALTLIQGDVNGDGIADFGIELVGRHDLVEGDFVL